MFGVSYSQNQIDSTLEATIENAATIRFHVTWAYLAAAPRKAEKNLTVDAPAPTRALTQPKPPVVAPVTASPTSKVQWEMVIPKMTHPPAKRAPAAIAAPLVAPPVAAPPPPQPAQEAPIRPLTLFAETEPEKARHVRLAKWGLVAAAVIGVAILVRPKTEESVPQASMSFGGAWSRRTISPPGRQIIAYDLSRDESNYRMEFSWTPSDQPVGWLFRTRDSGNYYGAKLSRVRPGDSSAVAVEHFSVLGGIETPHSRKVIALMRSEPAVRIRMDASGPVFTLYVQGGPVDNWTDQRLPTGGFGFYAERGQQPVVQALRFTFFNQGALSMAPNSPW
jgi:hypothetical protein